MAIDLASILSILRDHVTQIVKGRLDRRPIASVEQLIAFNHMRAAYVAQTSLYGYLKTRMGTRYVEMFQDEAFAASLNKAKWPIFASCLADLTVFSCALVHREAPLDREGTAGLAAHCFAGAIEKTFDSDARRDVGLPAVGAFDARAGLTDWHEAAEGENAFGRSPADLIAYAPVVEEFKALDSEIVTNSMRFRWRDVRSQLRQRLKAGGVAEDWRTLRETA